MYSTCCPGKMLMNRSEKKIGGCVFEVYNAYSEVHKDDAGQY